MCVTLGVALLAGAAVLATAGRAAAAGPVTHYVINPSPIAAPASLAANTSVTVSVKAEDATNTAVPGAQVYLSFAATTGGGTAAVGTTPLGSTPVAFVADSSGQVVVKYRTPGTLPTGGQDVITAKNAQGAATITNKDAYNYGTVTAYTYSHIPLGSPGTLAGGVAVKEVLTARVGTAAAPGATVYLSFTAAAGGGTASVGATPLTSTPLAVVTSSTGKIVITFTTPATLPTTGTDIITAEDATAGATVSREVGYSYGAPAMYVFTPSPIAPAGTLAGSTKVTVRVTAVDGHSNPVTGATVYLSFVPTTGGGTAKVFTKALGATALSFKSDINGQISITYMTPAKLPTSGKDTITAQNLATSPTITATDSYTF